MIAVMAEFEAYAAIALSLGSAVAAILDVMRCQ